MATYAISDIHGRYKELNQLLDLIRYSSTDSIVFLGDYIDRGPSSKEVIDKLIELDRETSNTYFLKGNHEDMAIRAKVNPDARKFWLRYGGDKTLESYPEGIPKEHWSFIYGLRKYVETDDSIFVHAGLDEHLEMSRQTDEQLLWQRLSSPLNHMSGKKIYCGHSSQRFGYPKLFGSARCIECSGWLTAIDIQTDWVYQVNSAGCTRDFKISDS